MLICRHNTFPAFLVLIVAAAVAVLTPRPVQADGGLPSERLIAAQWLPADAAALLAEGNRQLRAGNRADAAGAWRRANQAAGGKCLQCLAKLAQLGPFFGSDAVDGLRRAVQLLAGDPLAGAAQCALGYSLVFHNMNNEEVAAEAERIFQSAAALDPALRTESSIGIAWSRMSRRQFAAAAAAAREAVLAASDHDPAGVARSIICVARQAGHLSSAEAPMPPAPEVARLLAQPLSTAGSTAPSAPAAGGGAPPPAGDAHLLTEPGISKPAKIYAPPPEYTAAARQQRIGGLVILESVIDADGCVVSARVLKSLDKGLDVAALHAVRQWVFVPALLGGRPVKVYYTLTVNYSTD